MPTRPIESTRDFIAAFKDEIVTVDKEVDPVDEVAGIVKALDDSYAVLFTNIKGYPGVWNIGNILGRADRVARIFNVSDPRKLKFKCLDAIKNPLPPRMVKDAPCQEVVVTDNIDVMRTIPVIRHSPRDTTRLLGCGIHLVCGPVCRGGTDVSFRRVSFRGKDWGSLSINLTSHVGQLIVAGLGGERVPTTINISTPPAVTMCTATKFDHAIVPHGSDELAIAGALQGSPIDIVKARTVDAYAIANAEWVIEGYIDTTDKNVWESDEAQEAQKTGEFVSTLPEWWGHAGRSKAGYRFQVTAITHRKSNPIFSTILAKSYETDSMCTPFREACFFEVAERHAPGFVTDVHILPGVGSWNAYMAFQVRKRQVMDEGMQKELLAEYMAQESWLNLAVAVDEDVDIYSAQDIIWAIANRSDVDRIVRSSVRHEAPAFYRPLVVGIGIDATVPWNLRGKRERAHYASDIIDLSKWIPKEKIAEVQAMQSEYARYLARTGR